MQGWVDGVRQRIFFVPSSPSSGWCDCSWHGNLSRKPSLKGEHWPWCMCRTPQYLYLFFSNKTGPFPVLHPMIWNVRLHFFSHFFHVNWTNLPAFMIGFITTQWTEVCVSKESSRPHRCMVAWQPALHMQMWNALGCNAPKTFKNKCKKPRQACFTLKWQVADWICQFFFLRVGVVFLDPGLC